MNKIGFKPSDVLLPVYTDLKKWSVVACDQYTSEPDYWEDVTRFVGAAPSALKIIFPELFLGKNDGERIENINKEMKNYLKSGVFDELRDRFVYIERTLNNGTVRKGLLGAIDLMAYDYTKTSQSLIRATEGTVLERIPPRVRIRKDAPLEMPHVMLLIDDEKRTVIEPLTDKKQEFKKLYDFELMQQSGSIKGYEVDQSSGEEICEALSSLADQEYFETKYHVKDKGVLLFAVGDGNHSLATAKECYEQLKGTMPEDEWRNHPARFALVEVVNVHDEALGFEPIHRVVFGVDPKHMLDQLKKYYKLSENGEGQSFNYVAKGMKGRITVHNPSSNLAVGTLQNFIDSYIAEFGGKVDYIHGDEVVAELGVKEGNIGFLLPPMEKSELFETVILDGALPRKTFSMGHACDKRFYLECRKIK